MPFTYQQVLNNKTFEITFTATSGLKLGNNYLINGTLDVSIVHGDTSKTSIGTVSIQNIYISSNAAGGALLTAVRAGIKDEIISNWKDIFSQLLTVAKQNFNWQVQDVSAI